MVIEAPTTIIKVGVKENWGRSADGSGQLDFGLGLPKDEEFLAFSLNDVVWRFVKASAKVIYGRKIVPLQNNTHVQTQMCR